MSLLRKGYGSRAICNNLGTNKLLIKEKYNKIANLFVSISKFVIIKFFGYENDRQIEGHK